MIPYFGLSLVVHALILLVKFLSKNFGLSANELKAVVLRLGLKISPRFFIKALSRDFFLRQVFAYSIIASVFILAAGGAVSSLKISLRGGNNLVFVAGLFKSTVVMATQKNSAELYKFDVNKIRETQYVVNSGPLPIESLTYERQGWLLDNYQPNDYYMQSAHSILVSKSMLKNESSP
jgi:hypothetical protein